MWRVALCIAFLSLLTETSHAQLIAENTTTPVDVTFARPPAVEAGQEWQVKGENTSSQTITLVLRLDDAQSVDYYSRVNIERVIPPGPFVFRLDTSGLKTENKRLLDLQHVRRLMLFVGRDQPAVRVEKIEIATTFSLPVGVYGWDLGSATSPLYPGFKRLTPLDKEVEGVVLKSVARSGGDALLSDGIRGLERVRLRVPNGKYRVTLWVDDLGEWEYLPHSLARAVWANERKVWNEAFTEQQWLEQKYLVGRVSEAVVEGDVWDIIGARRGGQLTFVSEVTTNDLTLRFEGKLPDDRYLAGVLVEPASSEEGLRKLTQSRRERFMETWRVGPMDVPPRPTKASAWLQAFAVPFKIEKASALEPKPRFQAAPGTGLTFDAVILSDRDDGHPAVALTEPRLSDQQKLSSHVRYGHWSYERPASSSTILEVRADQLRSDLGQLKLYSAMPRRLNVDIQVPRAAQSGIYRGELQIATGPDFISLPFEVEVLAVGLPELNVPVGVYLERLPFWDWFAGLRNQGRAATECDLAYLRELGLTGVAPPLATPTLKPNDFQQDLVAARNAGFAQDLLAYAPVKRLIAQLGAENIGPALAKASLDARRAGLEPPVWAIADEPGRDAEALAQIAMLSKSLRFAVPNIKLAVQLNHPSQKSVLDAVEVALVNTGYGVSAADISEIKRHGSQAWLYNMPDARLAAGFYLWRVGAQGYLQWHARMPTADPFDPTDGREADIQLLLPTKEICPKIPDIHARLLAISQGIVDLRWLLWLEQHSNEPAAGALRARLIREISDNWGTAKGRTDQFDLWRAEIVRVALATRKVSFTNGIALTAPAHP